MSEETETKQQLNVRVAPSTRAALKAHAEGNGQSVQAYVSGLVESAVDPDREAFVSGLVDDMTGLLAEFEEALPAGQR